MLIQAHHIADVLHVPKDVITVLEKRGGDLEEMMQLFENFDTWWVGLPGPPPAVRLPSSSASSSGHGPMQVDASPAPPPSPVSSVVSDLDPVSFVPHPPTRSPALSTESDLEHESTPIAESASDLDRESKIVDHDTPPPVPESSIESGHSHILPSNPILSTESEHWYTPPSSLCSGLDSGSDSDSDSERWSTMLECAERGIVIREGSNCQR